MDGADGYLDWGTWLAAQGYVDLKPAASLRFDSYEQMIGAALSGQGVAMGIGRLVSGLLQEGRLVAPFGKSVIGARAYYVICSSLTGTRPHVQAFVDWLIAEAKTVAIAPSDDAPSAPHHQRRSQPAQGREHAQRGDAPGAGVVGIAGCSRWSW